MRIDPKSRWIRHLVLGAVALLVTAAVAGLAGRPGMIAGLSLGSAWAGLVFLAATLLLGPVNVLRRRANPVSSYVRRDIGIWAGVLGLVHTLLGLTVHLGGDWMRYFVWPASAARLVPVRYDWFGIANHTGLIAAAVLLLLLVLSNDLALRRLGARRWKGLQRLAYLAAALLLVHGPVYQLLERRLWPYLPLFVLIALAVVAVQVVGASRRRGRSRHLPSASHVAG